MTQQDQVRRLLGAHALSSMAMSVPWPLLLLAVWHRVEGADHEQLLLGLAGSARLLPYVLVSWAAGMLADRVRRDRLLRATIWARIGLLGAMAVAVQRDWLVAAVVIASLAVAAGTPAYPALAAAMPSAAGATNRRATDVLVTIEVGSFVVGPAVGALLLAPATRPWVPAAGVALAIVALVLVARVELPRADRSGDLELAGDPGSHVLTVLRGSPAASRAVGVAGLLNAVDAALVLALLPLATDVWRDDTAFGPASAFAGFGALGAPLLGRLGRNSAARARWSLVLLGTSLAVVPLAPTVGWALAPLAVTGAATVKVESALTETIQDAVEDRHRAAVLGLTDTVMISAALLASLATPWLASALGPRGLLVALAAGCLATCLLTRAGAPGAHRRARRRELSAAAPRR